MLTYVNCLVVHLQARLDQFDIILQMLTPPKKIYIYIIQCMRGSLLTDPDAMPECWEYAMISEAIQVRGGAGRIGCGEGGKQRCRSLQGSMESAVR